MHSKTMFGHAVRRTQGANAGLEKDNLEQTVNGLKGSKNAAPIMYKKIAPLDNSGFLWYHARVKLGCFATALSDLTGRKASQKKISRLREMELASVFFRLFGFWTVDPASPATLMSALSPCLFRGTAERIFG